MFRTIDRYVIREVLPPTVIALCVFTFTLELPPITTVAEALIQRGIGWAIILRVMASLVPQALAMTIPMSLLVGVLVAFGRLSSDREYVALQACGVGIFRLLRPVMLLGVLAWAGSSYVALVVAPAAARTFRELTFQVFTTHIEGELQPRVFIDAFPGRVMYIRDVSASEGWIDIFVADSLDPKLPAIYLARHGHLAIDRAQRRVSIVLEDGTKHVMPPDQPGEYRLTTFRHIVVDLDWASVFPSGMMARTVGELTIAELRSAVAGLRARGVSPAELVMQIHQRFSIPAGCLLLAVLGLTLGGSTANGGRLASFAWGGAIIFISYVILFTGRALAISGRVPPWAAMWAPDMVLSGAAAALLFWRARGRSEFLFRFHRAAGRNRTPPLAGVATRASSSGRRVRGPVLRTLDRYVVRQYLKVFALAFSALVGIFYVAILTDFSSNMFRSSETARLLAPYCLFEMPQIVYYVIPLSTLIAALVTIGVLTKNSEIVVMKACGISLYRAAAPLFVLAIVSGAALVGVQETLLPEYNRRAEAIRHTIRGQPDRSFQQFNRTWVMGRTGSIYHYTGIDVRRALLRGVSIFEFDLPDWRLRRRIQAVDVAEAPAPNASQYEWVATNGQIWSFPASGAPALALVFARLPIPLEPLEYFKADRPEEARMTYGELSRYITDLRNSGTNVTPYVVALRRKLSFPFVTIIMTLIAVPFGVTTGRRGALYGIGIGIGLALGYWMALSVFGALGQGGALTPVLAAWGPNIVFGAGAAYLVLTTRT